MKYDIDFFVSLFAKARTSHRSINFLYFLSRFRFILSPKGLSNIALALLTMPFVLTTVSLYFILFYLPLTLFMAMIGMLAVLIVLALILLIVLILIYERLQPHVKELVKVFIDEAGNTVTGTPTDTLSMHLTDLADIIIAGTEVVIHEGAWTHTWTGLPVKDVRLWYTYIIVLGGQTITKDPTSEEVTIATTSLTNTVTIPPPPTK